MKLSGRTDTTQNVDEFAVGGEISSSIPTKKRDERNRVRIKGAVEELSSESTLGAGVLFTEMDAERLHATATAPATSSQDR